MTVHLDGGRSGRPSSRRSQSRCVDQQRWKGRHRQDRQIDGMSGERRCFAPATRGLGRRDRAAFAIAHMVARRDRGISMRGDLLGTDLRRERDLA